MNVATKISFVTFMLAISAASAFGQHATIKKRTISVVVQKDRNCLQGISVSTGAIGGRRLCADYPAGISNRFRKFVGSQIRLEAFWTFEGELKHERPVALGVILGINGDSVNGTTVAREHLVEGRPSWPVAPRQKLEE